MRDFVTTLHRKARPRPGRPLSYVAVGAHDDQDVHDNHDGVPGDVEVEPPEQRVEADDDDEHDVEDVPDEVDAAPDHDPLFHVLRNENNRLK